MSIESGLVEAFKDELGQASTVLIGTHLNPDGDALGSALALSHHLWRRGIKNEVLCQHEAPASLQFLPGVQKVRQEPILKGHDLAILLDLNHLDRLGSVAPFFHAVPRMVLIDHHVPHDPPGQIQLVDVTAPATAVILARLLRALDAEITSEIATCLLTGIVTDTGSFRFRNTTPESLTLSAWLLECGANINQVSEEVFARKPLGAVRLLGLMLDSLALEAEDQLAYAMLPFEAFGQAGARDEDTEGFVNEILAVQTVRIAALFRETKPNWIRVSLRSRGDLDVASVAREMGGGGHRNAAGCSFDSPMSEAVEALLPRLRTCLASS